MDMTHVEWLIVKVPSDDCVWVWCSLNPAIKRRALPLCHAHAQWRSSNLRGNW